MGAIPTPLGLGLGPPSVYTSLCRQAPPRPYLVPDLFVALDALQALALVLVHLARGGGALREREREGGRGHSQCKTLLFARHSLSHSYPGLHA